MECQGPRRRVALLVRVAGPKEATQRSRSCGDAARTSDFQHERAEDVRDSFGNSLTARGISACILSSMG
jgi:hypothetical protein